MNDLRNNDDVNVVLRPVKVGVFGVVLVFLCLATFFALTLPPKGTADSLDHLDYIWQVSNGQLPEGTGHQLPAAVAVRGSATPQWAASHPPLYYTITASVAGQLLHRSHFVGAVMVI